MTMDEQKTDTPQDDTAVNTPPQESPTPENSPAPEDPPPFQTADENPAPPDRAEIAKSVYPDATNPTSKPIHQPQTMIDQPKAIMSVGTMFGIMAAIFFYGAFIGQDEGSVGLAATIFGFVGFIFAASTATVAVQKLRNHYDSMPQLDSEEMPENEALMNQQKKDSALLIPKILGIVVLSMMTAPVGGWLLLLFIPKLITSASNNPSGRPTGTAKGLLYFMAAAGAFVSIMIPVFIGYIFLGLRACELSSSKCY
jgi:hypothetical protein